MTTCPCREDLSDLIDGAVPWARRRQLRQHVAGCAGCAQRLAEEEGLRDGARSCATATATPARLRPTVLAALSAGRRTARSRRGARRATVASVLAACATAGVLATVLHPAERPLPAYAEVEAAMRQIRTARWTEKIDFYDIKKGRVQHITSWVAARMNPPAMHTVSTDGGDTIVTAQGKPAQAAGAIRQAILFDVMPAQFWADKKRTPVCRMDQVNGRRLCCYAMGLGSGRSDIVRIDDRLTKPGYRNVMWADPDSHRVVRSLSEYYDGQRHFRVVGYDYLYDVPLPDSIFTPAHGRPAAGR